ncbi:hypothetical protein Plo01_57320 [Planobispora longispora]|uniref:Uncharacterized protein n=1 Tax=Planobispora longispora TaxID=28887 RepID=A0A8J3RW57_9ACTN|nr:hypothetical protein Plo01_57320 [Planobispora longispora]
MPHRGDLSGEKFIYTFSGHAQATRVMSRNGADAGRSGHRRRGRPSRRGVADRSTLYRTFWRRSRPTADLSHGWGSDSQWGTDGTVSLPERVSLLEGQQSRNGP